MLAGVKRGDRVVTGGGIIGLVTKVIGDNELQVELAEGVRVRVLKQTITDIVTRGESVRGAKEADEDDKPMLPPQAASRPSGPAGQPVRREEVAAGRNRMLNLPRWQTIVDHRLHGAGGLFALPNLLPGASLDLLPNWYAQNRINLGLDLRGGAHFLLEADLRTVLNERLTNLSRFGARRTAQEPGRLQGHDRQSGDGRGRRVARREPARQGDRGDPHRRSLARRCAGQGDTIRSAYSEQDLAASARK